MSSIPLDPPSQPMQRSSTRTRQQPASFAEEQAADTLARMESRQLHQAMRYSLADSWESDSENSEIGVVEEEEEEQEEKKEMDVDVEEIDGPWTDKLADIIVDPPVRNPELVNPPPPVDSTPLQLLQLFLPEQLVEEFAKHTNAAAPAGWKQTSAAELYAFIGVHIFMGIVELPTIHMYWSEDFGCRTISSIFSRDRYKAILRYFHVVPSPNRPPKRNPIPFVQSLVDTLNQSFKAHYRPTRYVSLDEAMCAWKGRSDIKQYIPSKPHKWGFKIYCVSSEEYLLRCQIYEGKEQKKSEKGVTYDTVIKLLSDYHHQQLVVYTDNYFTSPTLMEGLKAIGLLLCGSVKTNRTGNPRISEDDIKQLQQGEYLQRQRGNATFVVWKDQSVVKVLYNHVSPLAGAHVERWRGNDKKDLIACPQAIHDYFNHARSVDIMNQLHYSYVVGRKARRSCWPRLAWWLIDMCILNAFKLWTMVEANSKVPNLTFRQKLMRELLDQLPVDSRPRDNQLSMGGSSATSLAMVHSSERVLADRDCKICSKQPNSRHRTHYICSKCNVHLCLGECFRTYHSRF